MELRECKRCLLLASGDTKSFELIQQHIAKIKPQDKCDDALYNERLEKCKNCDFLISGTCIKCGCYPEFRAAFKNKKCPLKAW